MAEAVGPNPIPEPITRSGLAVGLELFATLPASASSGAVTRLQQLVTRPGSDLLYSVDDRGLISVIDDGEVRAKPLLDLRDAGVGFHWPSGEAGLRSLAFHPDFARLGTDGFGKLYTVHSATLTSGQAGVRVFEAGGDGVPPLYHDVVTEWTFDSASGGVEPGSRRELLRIEKDYYNHGTNQLLFDPNLAPGDRGYGLFYLGIGDGGLRDDPFDRAGDLGQIQGKIIRINPLLQDDGRAYRVPADNPFAGDPDALPEIWAYGFRNPQSMAFDTAGAHRLLVGDIGQGNIEEINVVLRGRHYGWDDREGTFTHDGHEKVSPLPPGDAALGLMYPLAQYDHEEIETNNPYGFGNAAIAGGFVYRGDAIPELEGQDLFADFPTGRIFHVPVDGPLRAALDGERLAPGEQLQPRELTVLVDGREVSIQELMGSDGGRVDLRFGQDADGDLYVFAKQTGTIWKLVIGGEHMTGTADADVIRGTGRSDTIDAGQGDDWVNAGSGRDRVLGLDGDDRIDGGRGSDDLRGNAGDDRLLGGVGNGNDRLDGGHGDDVLFGGDGADRLVDRAGSNELHGGDGNDVLSALGGDSRLYGDAGSDRFVIGDKGGFTRILDLEAGEVVDLEPALGDVGAALAAHRLRLVATDGGGTLLKLDADGSGAGLAVTFARIEGVSPAELLADHLLIG